MHSCGWFLRPAPSIQLVDLQIGWDCLAAAILAQAAWHCCLHLDGVERFAMVLHGNSLALQCYHASCSHVIFALLWHAMVTIFLLWKHAGAASCA